MQRSKQAERRGLLLVGTLGGIAGGLAEIVWITAYGMATGAPLDPVARGIVDSTIPQMAASPWAPELGILIHLGLAAALGIGLAMAVRQIASVWASRYAEFSVAIAVLLGVWSANFLLVLPTLNPGFVHLLPYGVTLLSKMMFAVAAAGIFRANHLLR